MASSYWEKVRSEETNVYAIAVSWFVGVPVLTLLGFYAGTVLGNPPPHYWDIQARDIVNGHTGSLMGLAVGIILAASVSYYYPKAILAEGHDAADEEPIPDTGEIELPHH